MGKILKLLSTGENSLNRIQIAYALRSRNDKWNLIKLQSFSMAKDTLSRTKWQPRDWEKIFTNCSSDKVLIANIYKESNKLDSKEPNNPNKS